MMKKYSVCEPEELRTLCIRKNWFTAGTNEQYTKLFKANEQGASLHDIATIIWLCSDTFDSDLAGQDEYQEALQSSKEHENYIKMLKSLEEDDLPG